MLTDAEQSENATFSVLVSVLIDLSVYQCSIGSFVALALQERITANVGFFVVAQHIFVYSCLYAWCISHVQFCKVDVVNSFFIHRCSRIYLISLPFKCGSRMDKSFHIFSFHSV